MDTLDNLMMINAYGWALNKPQRRLYYNMTVTATSVLVALVIGGLEAAGLLAEKFDLEGAPWRLVASLNDHLGNAGFVAIGLFAVCWGISVLNYRWRPEGARSPAMAPSALMCPSWPVSLPDVGALQARRPDSIRVDVFSADGCSSASVASRCRDECRRVSTRCPVAGRH